MDEVIAETVNEKMAQNKQFVILGRLIYPRDILLSDTIGYVQKRVGRHLSAWRRHFDGTVTPGEPASAL